MSDQFPLANATDSADPANNSTQNQEQNRKEDILVGDSIHDPSFGEEEDDKLLAFLAEQENASNKNGIFKIKTNPFEKRSWFVPDKLTPEEEIEAKIYRQEALEDRKRLYFNPNDTKKKTSLIHVKKDIDSEEISLDTDHYEKEKEKEKIKETEDFDDMISMSILNCYTADLEKTREKVYKMVTSRLEAGAVPDLLGWDQLNNVCMSSLNVEEIGSVTDPVPLPNKEELRKQLFGQFPKQTFIH